MSDVDRVRSLRGRAHPVSSSQRPATPAAGAPPRRGAPPGAAAHPGAAAPYASSTRRVFHGITALGGLTLGFTAPLTAVFAVQLGTSAFAAGLTVASLTMVVFLLDLFGTKALPYLEPRRSITVGMIVWGIGSLASAAAPDFSVMAGARLFQGLGLAAFSAAGPQLAVRLAGAGRVGTALAEYQAAQTFGSTIAPLAGGAVVALAAGTAGSRLSFAVCGVIAFGCAAAARLLLPRLPNQVRPRLSVPRLPGLRRRRSAATFVSAACGQGVRSAVVLTIVPLVAAEGLGLSTTALGLFLTLTYCCEMVASRLSGRWSDRRGRRPVLVVGAAGGLVAAGVLTGAHLSGSVALFAVGVVPLGVAGGCLLGILPAVVVDLAPRPEDGIAGMRLSRDLGMTACPIVAGAVLAASGAEAAIAVAAGLYLAVGAITLAVGETRRVAPEAGPVTLPPPTAVVPEAP